MSAQNSPPPGGPSFTDHLWCAADSPFVKGMFPWVFGLLLIGLVVAAYGASATEPEQGERSTPYVEAKKTIKQHRLLATVALIFGLSFATVHSVLYAGAKGNSCDIDLDGTQDVGVLIATALFVLALGSVAGLANQLRKS